MKRILLLFVFVYGIALSALQAQSPMPKVESPVYFDVTPPLTEMTPTDTPSRIKSLNKDAEKREYPFYEFTGEDPVWQKAPGNVDVSDGIITNFEGTNCLSGLSPSDDNGDIGPNHYVQVVNSKLEIYDRNGTTLYGPVNINTLFSGIPGGTYNDGDPIVLYDQAADRWLISQFSISGSTKYMHIAVSQTANPLGSYYRWAYSWGSSVPDYPKFGVWRDSYLLGLNCGTDDIAAFDRSEMLAGISSPSVVKFDNPWRPASGLHCVQPLDNDGTFAAVGEPALFITINDGAWGGSDQLWVYELAVNWASPGSATFNRVQQIGVSSFDSNFGGTWDNIPQPGTSQKLELLSQVLMYRAHYRNFGSYEAIVCCHDVDVNGSDHAGIRWYELRRTTGNWYIRQQSSYAPDSHHRWMGAININGSGDIALGFSIASSSMYPSIRYTGRLNNDPLGTMTFAETVIYNGIESQTNGNRWGDYSSMSVDPTDDKTFWYTTQYAGGSAWDWGTRVAAFKFSPYCTASGGCDEYIQRVQLGDIDNTSGCDGYRDYTNIATDLPLNAAYTLTVTNGSTSYPSDQCGVWVDWNRDNDFYDAGEALTVSGTPGVGPYTATVDPPVSATTGPVTMRIRITYTGAVDPCGATSYGEVEDYTINLTPASTTNTWIGVTSTDWFDGTNWSLGTVPTTDVNASIPGGTPYAPVINSGTAYCKNCTVTGNQVLTQNGTSYFYIHGNLNTDAGQYTSTGSAYLYFDGSLNTNWDDDNENDIYQFVRVNKDVSTAWVSMWQNMTCDGNFEIREGEFRIDATWTLTVTSTGTTAFEVEDGGTLTLVDEHLDIAGRIHFYDGSQASVQGGTIRCGGDFLVDANTSYDIGFIGGTLIMDGGSTQYINDLDGGTLDLFNLTIDKSTGTCYIGNANLDVNGNLVISDGVFNCNNGPSPTATYNINLAGNWTNSVGAAGFVESTGRVTFDGPGHQYVYSSETFNILEAKMGAALRVNNAAYTVTCQSYDWTDGGIDMIAGTFIANDVADNGLFGGYWVNPGATLTLYQDAGQYVDLNGTIWMGGGNMNVYGGNGASYWSYAGNAEVAMSDGILDFKDVGIYVYNSATYTFSENITGGKIRTSSTVNASRSEFTPAGGVVEMYGPSDAALSQSNGATFYDFLINKSTKEGNPGPTSPTYENRDGEVLFIGGGGKANTVTPNTNVNITNNLDVAEGTLNLGTYTFDVAKDANFDANLTMTSGNFNVGTASYDNLNFYSGSNGNVTGGAINLASWFYAASGSAFTATAANTMYFAGSNVTGMDVRETGIMFGNVDISKTSVNHLLYTGGQLVELAGNLTLHGVSVLDMQTDNSMHVHGVVTDASGTKVYVYNGPGDGEVLSSKGPEGGSSAEGAVLEIDTDFTLNGLMDLSSDGNVLVHGNFDMTSTGVLTIGGAAASFIVDKSYNDSEAWQDLYGTINLSDGLFEITHNSMRFGATSVNNISGGTMRCGYTFYAVAANVFKPTGGVVEMVGADPSPYVRCEAGNYFYNLTIDRANELAMFSDIQINNDILIESGPLNSNFSTQYNLSVGRNWTNNGGDPAFIEGTGTVTFFGTGSGDILTAENFYNVTLNKTYANFDGLEVMSVPVVVGGNLTITDGTLELNSNTDLTVGGNVTIALNAGLNAGGGDINIELFIGGDWTNNNTTYNTVLGYTTGGEIITWNGSLDQVITTAATQEDFTDFVINKPAGNLKPADNIQVLGDFEMFTGNFTYQVAGLTHFFHGDFTMNGPGNYTPGFTSTTVFKGTADQVYERLGGSGGFGNILVDKTADKSSVLIEVSGGEPIAEVQNPEESKALTVTLNTSVVAFNGGTVTIDEGTLNLNGKNLKSTGALNINAGGILSAPAGSQLMPNGGLFVNNGGILRTLGSSGNTVLVHNDGSNLNTIEINSGGTIAATYTVFQDMTANGLYIKSGAIVDATNSFHNCTFQLSASAPSALMTIHNSQTFSVNNAVFPTNTWGGGYNVWKAVNSGHVTFNNATGGFAGPAYEYDPYSRIDWTGFTPGLWTGTVSNNWFTGGNWSDGNVPDLTVAVTIPAGTPHNPVINNPAGPAEALNVIIDAGASLTIQNGALNIDNDLDIYGQFGMTLPASQVSFYQVNWRSGSTDNVTSGTFYPEYAWWFNDGTNASLDPGSTVVFNSALGMSGFGWQDPDAQIGNLVVNKSAGDFIIGTVSSYAPKINGDVDVMAGNHFITYDYDMTIAGYLDINATSTFHMYSSDGENGTVSGEALLNSVNNNMEGSKGGFIEIGGDLNVAGELDIADGNVLQHGLFELASTGVMSIDGGSFVNDHAYGSEAWQYLYGTLNLPDGLFEIMHNSINIGASFVDNISGGIIRTGHSFSATGAGVFEPTGGVVEFTGTTGAPFINCSNDNYFHDFYFNSAVTILLYADLIVKNDFTIDGGTLDVDIFDTYIGGNWTNNVGDTGFDEGVQTVFFNGDGSIQWVNGLGDTFYNVVQYYNAPGSNLQLSEPIVVLNDMTLEYLAFVNNTFDVQGILDISAPGSKFTVNIAGNASVANLVQGGMVVNNGGTLNVLDLAESGFFGYWKNTAGLTNVTQDAVQWTDINCTFEIANGNFNVFGGNGDSWWAFAGDANIIMSNGTLDFKDFGVIIQTSGTYTFSENITGGTIRVAGGFQASNSAFTPAGGTIEMYGGTDAYLATSNGSSANNVMINKSGGDESVWSYKDREGNLTEGGKANAVNLSGIAVVNGNLTLDEGTLNTQAFSLGVYGDVAVNAGGVLAVNGNGTLRLDNLSNLNVNSGGVLNVLGSSGNPSTVTHIAGYYYFNVNSGGTIAANYGIFEYMTTNGVYVKSGAIVNGANSFHNSVFRNGVANGRLLVVQGNQVFDVNNAVFPNNTWGGTYNVYKSVNAGHVTFIGATGGFAGAAFEYDPNNRIDWNAAGITVDITVIAEGPYNGTNMNALINGVMSLNQPFNPTLPYFGNPNPKWLYGGSESVGAIPNPNVVDWVMVELRDAANAGAATGATMIAQKACFLLRDGSIVELDGISPLSFPVTVTQNLFVAVWQRNHLGVMSANPVPLVSGTYTYNFSTGSTQAYGGALAHKQIAPGVWGMVSGDGNGDGNVGTPDKNDVWAPQAGGFGYLAGDYNLDSNVNNGDKVDYWAPNSGKGSQVPDGGYVSQIPD